MIGTLEKIFAAKPDKIIMSKPSAGSEYRRVCLVKKASGYQLEKYTEKQVFHENLSAEEAAARCAELMSGSFRQLNAFGSGFEYSAAVSRKGKVLFNKRECAADKRENGTESHDRRKIISSRRTSLFLRSWIWASSQRTARSPSRCMTSSAR